MKRISDKTLARSAAVPAIFENRTRGGGGLNNPQSGRGLKIHHALSMSWSDGMLVKMRPMRQMFMILFKISPVSFLPETRYMNYHVGDFVVTTYLWRLTIHFYGRLHLSLGWPCHVFIA